jgi:uncharacterized protein (TIGR00251 family)
MTDWCRHDPARRTLTLALHVQPNAKRSGFAGLHGDALKVRIAAPAVDDKANAALIAYIAHALDRPTSALRLIRGDRSRAKTIEVSGADPATVARAAAWIA